MPRHKLVIEIDEETKTIKVTHEAEGMDEAQHFLLKSLAIFGGDAKNQEVFIKMFGASAGAAWAYAQGFRISESAEGGPGLKSFYKQCAAHICQIIDPNAFQIEADANMWEGTDQTKWFGQDSEDVLRDKEKSEAKKKASERLTELIEPPTDKKHWN